MSDNTTFNPIAYTPPVYSGYWKIGDQTGMQIWMTKRPKWFHRKITYIFFGWKWADLKEKNT